MMARASGHVPEDADAESGQKLIGLGVSRFYVATSSTDPFALHNQKNRGNARSRRLRANQACRASKQNVSRTPGLIQNCHFLPDLQRRSAWRTFQDIQADFLIPLPPMGPPFFAVQFSDQYGLTPLHPSRRTAAYPSQPEPSALLPPSSYGPVPSETERPSQQGPAAVSAPVAEL